MRNRERRPRHDPLWGVLDHQGRSMAWLAQRTGYSAVYLNHIKLGIAPPSAPFRARCALALDLPESVLFFDLERPLDQTVTPEAVGG